MKHPQSSLPARCFAHPLKWASPLVGGAPATAITGVACPAAFGVLGFHPLRVARSAMDN